MARQSQNAGILSALKEGSRITPMLRRTELTKTLMYLRKLFEKD